MLIYISLPLEALRANSLVLFNSISLIPCSCPIYIYIFFIYLRGCIEFQLFVCFRSVLEIDSI